MYKYGWMLAGLLLLLGQDIFGQDEKKMNIHYMKMGSCFAASRIKTPDATSGFTPSDNYPESLLKATRAQALNKILAQRNNIIIALVLDTIQAELFDKSYKGYELYLMNGTNTVLQLNAQDSRLNLLAEAWMAGGNL